MQIPLTRPIQPGLFVETDTGIHLLGGLCTECERSHFPVFASCPYCSAEGDAITTTELPRRGTLWGWTSVTAPPPGYLGEVPFGFGVVELPVGLRVITRITESDPQKLTFGQTMELVTVEVTVPEEDAAPTDTGTAVVMFAFAPVTTGAER